MLKIFKFIGCFLERSERNYPRIFWLCTSLLGFCIFHEPVKKLVKTALKNQDVKNEYVKIKKRLEEGINPVDIGKKSTPVASNKVLIKGYKGRYLVEVSGNQVNVLGICARGNRKNVKSFENLMNEMYGVNLQY